MQDLKDLKRFFHVNDRGGQAPALRYARPSPFTVGRGPVPRHATRLKQDFQDLARLARFWGSDASNASWCAKTVQVRRSPNPGKS